MDDFNHEGRLQRLEELVMRAQAGAGLVAILDNRVQQLNASGAVVAAGAAITPDASLTLVGSSGQVRISATFSGQVPATATLTAILQAKIGGGAFVTQVAFEQTTAPAGAPGSVKQAVVFEFASGAAPGTVISVHWQTTGGDGALTLGNGAGPPVGAALLLEELP